MTTNTSTTDEELNYILDDYADEIIGQGGLGDPKTEAKQALLALIHKAVIEGRIDELNKLVGGADIWFSGGIPTKEQAERRWFNYINKRFSALKETS